MTFGSAKPSKSSSIGLRETRRQLFLCTRSLYHQLEISPRHLQNHHLLLGVDGLVNGLPPTIGEGFKTSDLQLAVLHQEFRECHRLILLTITQESVLRRNDV